MSELHSSASGTAGEPSRQAEAITTKERSQLQLVWIRFRRHKLAVVSLILLGLLVAAAFLGPYLWPWDHRIDSEIPSHARPGWDHPLGTTRGGQDIVGQLMRGAQQSLRIAITVSLVATVIGSLWGAIAGYLGGWVDTIMMRLADLALIVPLFVAVAAIGGSPRVGATWYNIALIIAAFSWAPISRVVRGVVLSLREQEFIEAAKAMGASTRRIVLRHLLPNAAGPIIVAATLLVAVAILVEATLSFLAFGIRPPDISLGLMVENARTAAFTRPWLFYPPGVLIILICLTINFIGDGLRDALDPRQTMVRR